MACTLISLDTSTSCTGYAKYVDGALQQAGCFDNKKRTDDKFDETIRNIVGYLDAESPDIVVIELTVVCRNAHTQRRLTELLGIVYAWCLFHDCYYYEMRPTQWRKLVSSPGEKPPKTSKELKAWSVQKVETLFSLTVNNDVADAVLIGFAYISYMQEIEAKEKRCVG